MQIWHLTPDAPRSPRQMSPDEQVALAVGIWPIEPRQTAWTQSRIEHPIGLSEAERVEAACQRNANPSSYWMAEIGPFARGGRVWFTVWGRSVGGKVAEPTTSFLVGARLDVALTWHQHQPLNNDLAHPALIGCCLQPIDDIRSGVQLTVCTSCPGILTWRCDDGPLTTTPLVPAGGVMVRVQRHHVTLGPVSPGVREARFSQQCTQPDCDEARACFNRDEYVGSVATPGSDSRT